VTRTSLGELVLDYEPPRLAGSAYVLRLDPDRAHPGQHRELDPVSERRARLSSDELWALPDSLLRLSSIRPDETLFVSPELVTGWASLPAVAEETPGEWSVDLVLPEAERPVDGVRTLQPRLRLEDLAGNVGEPVAATLHFDGAAPLLLADEQQQRLRLYREPWGDGAQPGRTTTRLQLCLEPPPEQDGAGDGDGPGDGALQGHGFAWCEGAQRPFAADALVRVFTTEADEEGRRTCGAELLAADLARLPGDQLQLELSGDHAAVCVSEVDRAGNASPPTLVRLVQWQATLGRKQQGSLLQNPHTWTHTSRRWETPLSALGRLDGEVAPGPLQRPDDDSLDRVGGRDRIDWLEVPRGASVPPGGRSGHGLVFDAGRGRALLFGGRQGEVVLGDTWEWHSTRWEERSLEEAPPARAEHAMAYHAKAGLVLLHGGQSEQGPLAGTWSFDGERWRWLEDAGEPPSARADAAMAYDPLRGEVVLFGGRADELLHADTWSFDGERWRPRDLPVAPTPRAEHALAWDPASRELVLFGGVDATGERADTWSWDGTRWLELDPGAAPSARRGHRMSVDGAGALLLVGGRDVQGPLGDVWRWTEQGWGALEGGGLPPPRAEAGLAFDTLRGRTLLFGGDGGGPRADTWEWDGAVWSAPRTLLEPASRNFHAMAYDRARQRVLLFGGLVDGASSDETWEWDGLDWMLLSPAHAPSPRTGAAMVYDAARERVVLFGGRPDDLSLADTWEWDGSDWTLRTPEHSPPARDVHTMAFDERRNRVVLFGGLQWTPAGWGLAPADVWEWDGEDWERRSAEAGPVARGWSAMVYDATRERTVLAGGAEGFGPMLGDTWAWDGERWEPLLQATSLPPMAFRGAAFDRTRGRVVLFGGADFGTISGQTWELGDGDWELVEASPAPAERFAPGMAYDEVRGHTLLFGGYDTGALGETWAWDGQAWQRLPTARPPARSGSSMAYDRGRGKLVLYGGTLVGESDATTWEWDGQAWTVRATTPAPAARMHATMAYDDRSGQTLLFGGRATDFVHNWDDWEGGMWAWDGERWHRLIAECLPHAPDAPGCPVTRSELPTPDDAYGVAIDRARGELVLFGGHVINVAVFAETWIWDGERWAERESPNRPPTLQEPAMVYDEHRERVILFGGRHARQESDEMWQWDGVDWSPLDAQPRPPARWGAHFVYDPARARWLLFGGRIEGEVNLADIWEWDGETWTELPLTLPYPDLYSHTMAHHDELGLTALFGGVADGTYLDDLWLLSSYHGVRPAQRFVVDLGAAGLPPGSELVGLQAQIKTGGLGWLNGEEAPGALLSAWDTGEGAWRPLSSSSDTIDMPEDLRWQSGDAAWIGDLLLREQLHLMLEPAGANAEDAAALVSDYAEVGVSYRLAGD